MLLVSCQQNGIKQVQR